MSSPKYKIGVDVGGTFTDFALIERGDGRSPRIVAREKVPSVIGPGSSVIRSGISLLASSCGAPDPTSLLRDTALVVYGTTAANNALIQRSWSRTGMLCTDGFRDTLEFREGYKERRYDWSYPPPKPLVPRYLRRAARERTDVDGVILAHVDEGDVRRAAAVFREAAVEAVAVCFLWSFANDRNEQAAAQLLRAELPGVGVFLSSEVDPELPEYRRTSSTVLTAALSPIVARTADQVERELADLGFTGALRFMQGNGGLASGENFRQRAVYALNSGPAAGPSAALAAAPGQDNVIVIDLGGTSCEYAALAGGRPTMVRDHDILRYRVGPALVRVSSLGAGGGSIAWLEGGRLLRVGPESAQADPGPACYGRGGTRPTLTDASVVLEYLGAGALLTGRLMLDPELAWRAVEQQIATPLGLTPQEAAHAIVETANNNMANAVREETVQRGLDPRDFVMVAGGGAGGLHAVSVAELVGVSHVVIPKYASTLCAVGAVTSMHQHMNAQSLNPAAFELAHLTKAIDTLVDKGREALRGDGVPVERHVVDHRLFIRYQGQVGDLSVRLDSSGAGVGQAELDRAIDRFHEEHGRVYGFVDHASAVEIRGVEVTVADADAERGLASALPRTVASAAGGPERRTCYLRGAQVELAVHDGRSIAVGEVVVGPAIVQEPDTTILVPDGWTCVLQPHGVYDLTPTGESEVEVH